MVQSLYHISKKSNQIAHLTTHIRQSILRRHPSENKGVLTFMPPILVRYDGDTIGRQFGNPSSHLFDLFILTIL